MLESILPRLSAVLIERRVKEADMSGHKTIVGSKQEGNPPIHG
jgi:hypothetical protein